MKLIITCVLIVAMFSCMESAIFNVKWYNNPVVGNSWHSNYGQYNRLNTDLPMVKRTIVNNHNFFRQSVNPPASNMLELKWSRKAADRARNWANQCRFLTHDSNEDRYVANYGKCGQNIFVSSHPLSWEYAINNWFLEYRNFTYGSEYNDMHTVGHYTQMVWATTHRIGCHFTYCPYGASDGHGFYNYVCDYCPTGNWRHKTGTPYKMGQPCGDCPNSCKHGKLCTNYCPYSDEWSNCESSLCPIRYEYCKATCSCQNKIHEWKQTPSYGQNYYSIFLNK